jgi:hypothetical protein
MLEPPKGNPAVITDFHEGWVEVEMAMSDGWYAFGKFAMQENELRLIEARVFPGERRPFHLAEEEPNPSPFRGPRLAEDGLPAPEPGEWSGNNMAAVDALKSGAQITAATMKRFPLQEMREHAEWHAGIRRQVYYMLPDDAGWASLKSDMAKYMTERTKPSDLRLAQIAAQYVELAEQESTRNRPRAALAKELGFANPEIVRDLLASARRAGLLDSNGQGTRGGRLTLKALNILERATPSEETKS